MFWEAFLLALHEKDTLEALCLERLENQPGPSPWFAGCKMKVQGSLYHQQGCGQGVHFLFLCGLSQPLMFIICYLMSHALRHRDTCQLDGTALGPLGPHPATWCLGHMHSAGMAPRAPLWVEGGSIH